jgi:hypothetical protein
MSSRLIRLQAAVGLCVAIALGLASWVHAEEQAPTQPPERQFQMIGSVTGLSRPEMDTMELALNGEVWKLALADEAVAKLPGIGQLKQAHGDLLTIAFRDDESPGTVEIRMELPAGVSRHDASVVGKTALQTYANWVRNNREVRGVEMRRLFVSERDNEETTLKDLEARAQAFMTEHQLSPAALAPARQVVGEALDQARVNLAHATARHEALAAMAEEAKKIAANKPVPMVIQAILDQPMPAPDDDAQVASIAQRVALTVARADMEVQIAQALVRQLEPEAEKERARARDLAFKRTALDEIEKQINNTRAWRDDDAKRLREIRLQADMARLEYVVASPE